MYRLLLFPVTLFLSIQLNFLAAQHADLIIYNAVIHTMDQDLKVHEAIAVLDGKISRVGKSKEILTQKGKNTIVVDALGKHLVPGIFDSHIHVIRAGRFYHTELRWDGVHSLKKALQMLKEQADRTPKGQWVRVVGGWSAYQFEEKRLPTLEEINLATGSTPAFILHLYGHAYLNKAGLEVLKINDSTPSPSGGLIEKDEYGIPTGLLIAEPNASILYSTLAKLPELNDVEKINSTLSYMRELNRFGITAVMDAGGGFQNYPDDYGISDLLCKEGKLTVRLPFFLFAQKAGKEAADFKEWIRNVELGHNCETEFSDSNPKSRFFGKTKMEYHVKGGGENLVMSGADFENFDQPRPELSPAMEGQLKEVLTVLVENRWPFRLHATYNESISRFLDVIEEVNAKTPLNGLLWFFDHAETISDKNLERVKKLKGGIAIQHRMAYQGESFVKRYGKQAAEQTPPVRKMIDMGIPVGMGSDGTRVSSYNPFVGLYWLVTGRTIGGLKHMTNSNILDRNTALKLFTKGSADLFRLGGDRGILKEGYLADFFLLSDDYFTIPEEKILKLESLFTIVNGKIVYASKEFLSYDVPLPSILPSWSPVKYFGGYQN